MNTPTDSTDRQALTTRIKHHALDCVMCGICVPHCPTFALSHNEADGPRGRISLALGLAEGRLSPDAGVVAHLDGCLTCRACESVCPSLVHYGELIDEVRDALAHNEFTALATARPYAAINPWTWIRDYILSRRQIFGAIWSALTLLDRLKLIAMIRRFGGRMGQTLPPVLPRRFRPGSTRNLTPEPQSATKAVGLFIGCTGESLNSDVVRASIKVLNALGYAVDIPTKQVCCGAMHQHGGDTSTATGLREENRIAFTGRDLSAIVVIGTACTGELQREQDDDVPFVEITDFLARIPDVEWPQLQPNAARVAIHLPCSQTRVLKQPRSTELLLKRIPELSLVPLTTNDRCCGAAGLHVLMYPDQANALRAPKLDEIEQLNPDYVVSANIGCATHIAVGLDASVLHPVELIAQAISTHQGSPLMVKISIFYPNQPDGRFDMAYYLERHIPMTLELVGKHPGYRRVTIEAGMGGEKPGSPATYAAICSFEFDSKESFLAAFEPHWPVIEADVPNYTNLEPILEYYRIVSA